MKFKTISIFTGMIAILSAVVLTTPTSAWGPERTTYTNESPAPYATFNSITNNVAVGDERNFVRVRELGTMTDYVDTLEVTPGKEYEVYIYYHNNAASNTNATGFGMATNVKVSSAYPTTLTVGEKGMVSGIISWSYVTPEDENNAKEGQVWDEAYLTSQTDGVVLRYKTGTATIHNSGNANGSILPTDLFTKAGTPIGFNKLTGKLPGCAEYSGHITYTLVAEKTDVSLEKQVSLDGENWSDNVTVKPGDYVTYKVVFKNTGNTDLTNVIFKDIHDEGLTLRTGSVKVYNVNHTEGEAIDDILDISGYNTGSAAAGALVQVIYQAKVSSEVGYCGKTLTNTISVDYNSDKNIDDDATVTVECEQTCETNPEMEGCKEEKNCKTNPEMEGCQKLPETGPVEIVMATIVVLGICAGGYYLYRTKKTLKTVETNATGKTDKDTNTTNKVEENNKKQQ